MEEMSIDYRALQPTYLTQTILNYLDWQLMTTP